MHVSGLPGLSTLESTVATRQIFFCTLCTLDPPYLVPVSEPLPKRPGGFNIISKDRGTGHLSLQLLDIPSKKGDRIFGLLRAMIYMHRQVTAMPKLYIRLLTWNAPLPYSFFSNYPTSLVSPLVLFRLCLSIYLWAIAAFLYISSISPILFTPPFAFLFKKGKYGKSTTALL